jgi:UDP-N-acetylmuramate: L-alanyl-gamma-D-glutamyl-meso-diaminopimelate ligase
LFTLNEIHKVHLVGIGGTAMAALAAMLQEKGLEVTGSDHGIYPPMSDFLSSKGIPVREGYGPQNLDEDVDLVIIGNALSRGNEEVEAVLDRGTPYCSLPEALRDWFIQGKRSLVIAGTHGKTTTTSLLSWILYESGRDPSFFVGGIPKNFASGFRLGSGLDIVLEGDEYDTAFFDKRPKFLHYLPRVVTLGSLEFDHADIYQDMEAIIRAFRALFRILPRNGRFIIHTADPHVLQLAEEAPCQVITCSLHGGEANWHAEELRIEDGRVFFRVTHMGQEVGECDWILPGSHNLANALLAVATAHETGVPLETSLRALRTFKGVSRRLEMLGTFRGVTVYDDFAHHPTAIHATLEALRELYPHRTLWAVCEPRSNTMCRRVFQDVLPMAFNPADRVLIGSVHPSRAAKLPEGERLDPDAVAAEIRALGKDAWHIPQVSEILEHLKEKAREGDIICIMSNGDFDGIQQRLKEKLSVK